MLAPSAANAAARFILAMKRNSSVVVDG